MKNIRTWFYLGLGHTLIIKVSQTHSILLPKVLEKYSNATPKITECTACQWLCWLSFELTHRLNADKMREKLREMHHFKDEKTKLETLLALHGYKGFFLPKFHCELNPIEREWAESKKYTRAHCDYSFKVLEQHIRPALDSVSLETIWSFLGKWEIM